ncbi:MAG: hypothetical protein EON89_08745 [Brevundimonas sp.]|nr:MAG: hypothetical protein EON89_08745 [Brevundimonas sp.]
MRRPSSPTRSPPRPPEDRARWSGPAEAGCRPRIRRQGPAYRGRTTSPLPEAGRRRRRSATAPRSCGS